jgi:ankyrin repeat protein
MKRNIAAVRSLVQQKADVNAGQVDGATGLHWAVHFDDLEMTKLLISAGANVEGGESLRSHTSWPGVHER